MSALHFRASELETTLHLKDSELNSFSHRIDKKETALDTVQRELDEMKQKYVACRLGWPYLVYTPHGDRHRYNTSICAGIKNWKSNSTKTAQ